MCVFYNKHNVDMSKSTLLQQLTTVHMKDEEHKGKANKRPRIDVPYSGKPPFAYATHPEQTLYRALSTVHQREADTIKWNEAVLYALTGRLYISHTKVILMYYCHPYSSMSLSHTDTKNYRTTLAGFSKRSNFGSQWLLATLDNITGSEKNRIDYPNRGCDSAAEYSLLKGLGRCAVVHALKAMLHFKLVELHTIIAVQPDVPWTPDIDVFKKHTLYILYSSWGFSLSPHLFERAPGGGIISPDHPSIRMMYCEVGILLQNAPVEIDDRINNISTSIIQDPAYTKKA